MAHRHNTKFDPTIQRRAFFGRRVGKSLGPAQRVLMEELLPQHRLDISNPAPDPKTLFPIEVKQVWLEIGFGGGEHLARLARENPDVGFIGVEPFINGLVKLLRTIDEEGLQNILLFDDDANFLLNWLPENSIDQLFLLYPDPWPKLRHHKRRFVKTSTIASIAKALKPGAKFSFASDIPDYVNWTLRHILASDGLHWPALGPDEWLTPYPRWQSTRYEKKAKREGRSSAYFTFLAR